MNCVCVDAGLVVKFVTPEENSALVEQLVSRWQVDEIEMVAPAFASAEVDSVLRQKVIRGELTQAIADAAFRVVCQMPIALDAETDCRERAWEIAKMLALPTVYDAVYLALAEQRGCEFWTADNRLYERVKDTFGFVKLLAG